MIKLFGASQILRKDETIAVTREGVTTYADGKPIEHDIQTFQVVANVQPVNGRDLLLVPEHDRFREMFWLYMDNKQFTDAQGLERRGPSRLVVNDRCTRLDANYQVQSVENWGSYSRARIMRVDVGPNATP